MAPDQDHETLAETARGDYDIVHAHYLLPVAAFALIPSGWRRKPLVITAHGTDIYSGLMKPWKTYITKALRRACRIIVVSQFLGDRLVENFGVSAPEGRAFVIANMGVDSNKFVPGDRDALKVAAGLPVDVPHLLFVGNFVEQKGVTDLARALVILKDLADRAIGYGIEGYSVDGTDLGSLGAAVDRIVRTVTPRLPRGTTLRVRGRPPA